MTDREKVIKGIDICLQRFRCGEDCPYYNTEKIGCMEQLREDSLALLKEQEEKPLRCDKCSYHREDGWCGMHERWVTETDYCSLGAWKGR